MPFGISFFFAKEACRFLKCALLCFSNADIYCLFLAWTMIAMNFVGLRLSSGLATHSELSYTVFAQSIGCWPCAVKMLLHCEKCLQPKKPRYAESGEGCGAVST